MISIKPYAEARDFQQARTPLLAGDFYERELDAARPRAFTVSGLFKLSHLHEANALVEQAIAAKMTVAEFTELLGSIVDAHGGTILSPARLELIFHNAITTARAAGEWRQSMEFVEDRPYFQYQGPRDDRNSAICKRLHNLILHYTDPALKHLWHPNHHWERHAWTSLALGDVKESAAYRTPQGSEYPVIDGQVIRPATGWDFDAADAMGADDKVFIDAARSLGTKLRRKSPQHYGLAALRDIDASTLPVRPALGPAVSHGAMEQGWSLFQRTLGIENGEGAWVLARGSDSVRINRDTYELALTNERGEFAGDNAQYFPLIRPALEQPLETWWVAYEGENGATYVKRTIGLFVAPDGTRQSIVLDQTENGWLWRITLPGDAEPYRDGLMSYSRAPRSN